MLTLTPGQAGLFPKAKSSGSRVTARNNIDFASKNIAPINFFERGAAVMPRSAGPGLLAAAPIDAFGRSRDGLASIAQRGKATRGFFKTLFGAGINPSL